MHELKASSFWEMDNKEIFVRFVNEQSLFPQGSAWQCRLDFSDPYSVEQANDLQSLPSHDGLSISSVEVVITRKGATKKQQTVSWMALVSHKSKHVRFPFTSIPLASSLSASAKIHRCNYGLLLAALL